MYALSPQSESLEQATLEEGLRVSYKSILAIISQLCRAARKVSPDWSQKTVTCHSFNYFSIVWGQLVTSHPSSRYMTLMSEQGRVKICKYSQSPFNQFSFSMLSLFLRLKTGLNCTRKVVDQRRILNPEFEQLF